MEWEVISEMVSKYYRVIEFYLETKKPDQVALAKKELQVTLETYIEMDYYLNCIDFSA
jgi:hypothetical protein